MEMCNGLDCVLLWTYNGLECVSIWTYSNIMVCIGGCVMGLNVYLYGHIVI